jgi:hypothetical protein
MSVEANWKVLPQRQGVDYLEVADESGYIQIAEVGGTKRAERAQIISAAQEMLAALRLCLPILLEERKVLLESYAVAGHIDGDEEEAIERCADLAEAIHKTSRAIAKAEGAV